MAEGLPQTSLAAYYEDKRVTSFLSLQNDSMRSRLAATAVGARRALVAAFAAAAAPLQQAMAGLRHRRLAQV